MRSCVGLVMCLLFWPLSAAADRGCVLVSVRGQLHLVTPPGQNAVNLDLEPYWAWEGVFTHVVMEETTCGVTVHATIDIAGPDWLHLDLDPSESGLTLHAWHSNPSQFDRTWNFNDYGELTTSKTPAVPYLMAILSRSGDRIIDLDALQREPAPMDAVAVSRGRFLVAQLSDERWSVREAANHDLHALPYRDHVTELTFGTHLTAEQRLRLADLIDQPAFEIAPNLMPGVLALCRNED